MAEQSITRIGRYEILGRLATGGMAEILLGKLVGPSGFERPVVIKRILPHLARTPAFVDMFIDEARIAADIRHPRVVHLHELAHEDGELFLVMEYLEGESLGGVMRRLVTHGESLDRALAAFVIAEACSGLHAAHELTDSDGFGRELVHRDVTPQNIFITYAGQVKLLDFGIAKAQNRATQTEAGQVKGKFGYMSPEQCLGKPLDRRSDLFALGILLWELTTGHRLFKRDNDLLTFKAICEERIPLPSEIAPDYPPSLERVCMKALARRREDRFASALELRGELLTAARPLGLPELAEEHLSRLMRAWFAARIEEKEEMLRRVGAGSVPTVVPVAEVDDHVDLPSVAGDATVDPTAIEGRPLKNSPGRGWRTAALVGLAVGMFAAVAWQGWPRGNDSAPPPEPSPLVDAPAPSSPVTFAPELPRAAPAASSDEAGALVTLRIETVPAGATVLVDGKAEGVSPIDVRLPRSDGKLVLELRKQGFADRREELIPDMSQRLVLPLAGLASPKPPPPSEIPRFQ